MLMNRVNQPDKRAIIPFTSIGMVEDYECKRHYEFNV